MSCAFRGKASINHSRSGLSWIDFDFITYLQSLRHRFHSLIHSLQDGDLWDWRGQRVHRPQQHDCEGALIPHIGPRPYKIIQQRGPEDQGAATDQLPPPVGLDKGDEHHGAECGQQAVQSYLLRPLTHKSRKA